MALLFCDGWDEYNGIADKYTGVGSPTAGTIDLTGTKSRTGLGCYVSQTPFGPYQSFTPKTDLIVGIAIAPSDPPQGDVFVITSGGIGTVSSTTQIKVALNSDGSATVKTGNDPFPSILGTTAPNLVFSGVYAYIELQAICGSVAGSFTLRINGATVLVKTNVNTNPAGSGTFDTVGVRGPGGGLTAEFDDFYICDTSGSHNNSLLGAIRVYTALPTSDNSPLQWTPSTGVAHFSLVNGVPAESQTTDVQTGAAGNTDQYLYNLTNIPAGVSILGVQHGLYAELDAAGSGSIGSAVGGSVAGNTAITTTPHIYTFPYDTDPATGLPWVMANLIAKPIGPNRTA